MIIHNECWIYRCIGCCSYLHKINPFHSHAPIYFNYFAFSLSCNTCLSVLEGIQKMETSAQNGSTPVVWQKFCTHHTAWKVSILGVFLVRICPYSDWLNAEKYGLEKLRIRTLFKQCQVIKIAPRNNFFFGWSSFTKNWFQLILSLSAASRRFLNIPFMLRLVHESFENTRSHSMVKIDCLIKLDSWCH